MKESKRNKRNIGSVISGTMRTQDLIPAFIAELKANKPLLREHWKLIHDIERSMKECRCEIKCIHSKALHLEQYYESEDASLDLNEGLFDALDRYAPPYFYFGANEGDGSDYGYWLSAGFTEEWEELKVSDLSEVPSKHNGEVLLVTDHGNVSLYVFHNGRGKEIWSIV